MACWIKRSSTLGPFPGERGKLPLTAIRFVDGHTTHRTGPIRPIEKLLHNGLPLRACPFDELVHSNPVGPGGSTVTADLIPRTLRMAL